MKKGKIYMVSVVPVHYKTKEKLESEQPGLETINCPYCDQLSWISRKKRDILKDHSQKVISGTKDTTVVMCWDCMKKYAEEFGNVTRQDI